MITHLLTRPTNLTAGHSVSLSLPYLSVSFAMAMNLNVQIPGTTGPIRTGRTPRGPMSSPYGNPFVSQNPGAPRQQQSQEPDSLGSPAPRRTPRDPRLGDSDDEIPLDPSLQQMSVRASFVDVISNSLELAPNQREQLHNLAGVSSVHQ